MWTATFFVGVGLLVFGPLVGGMLVLRGDKTLGNIAAWAGFIGGLVLAIVAFTRLLRMAGGPRNRRPD
jgi:hypothetical protein